MQPGAWGLLARAAAHGARRQCWGPAQVTRAPFGPLVSFHVCAACRLPWWAVVTLTLEVYAAVKKVDLRVALQDWDSAFGVANRVVFPVNADPSAQPQGAPCAPPPCPVCVNEDECRRGGGGTCISKLLWAAAPRAVCTPCAAHWFHWGDVKSPHPDQGPHLLAPAPCFM